MALERKRPSENGDGEAKIYPLLRQTPLSRFVSDMNLKELAAYCERGPGRPGTTLYRQGERAEALFIVVTGAVELRARPPGRRVYRTVEVVGEGCTVGDETIVGEERYISSARVQESADLLTLGLAAFERLAAARPEIAVALLRCAGSCLAQMVRRSAILTQAPADVALELLLRELSSRDDDRAVRITHAQLAGVLHLSRETVSRLLGQMAAQGVVELSRGMIHLRR